MRREIGLRTVEFSIGQSDREEYSDRLRAAFPSIRFCASPLQLGYEQRWTPLAPPNLIVPYVRSMGDARFLTFTAWNEPDDWEPSWAPTPTKRGYYLLLNQPNWFTFHTTVDILPGSPSFGFGHLDAAYERTDTEHLRFINAAYRILDKMTSRWAIVTDGQGGPRYKPRRYHLRQGRAFLKWAAEDPSRRHGMFRPAPQAYVDLGLPVPDDPLFALLHDGLPDPVR